MPDLKSVLESSNVPDAVKRDAWDAWYATDDPTAFESAFKTMPLPDDTKRQLWDLKFTPTTPNQLAEATGFLPAMRKITQLGTDIALPTIGAAAGGIGGGLLTENPAGVAAGRAMGAAVGGATGEALSQFLKQKGVLTSGSPPAQSDAELFMTVGLSGLSGPLQEASSIAAAAGRLPGMLAKGDPEAIQLAREFDVPLTLGKQKGGAVRELEKISRKTMLGSSIYRRVDLAINRRLVQAADRLAATIDSTPTPAGKLGRGDLIQKSLQSVYDSAGKSYRQVLDTEVMPALGQVPLDVTGNLRTAAQDLLNQLSQPTKFASSLRSVDAVQKAMSILQDFADPYTGSKILDAAGNARRIPKTLTFEDAHKLRTLIFDISSQGEMKMGRAKLAKLNGALHDEMVAAANRSGRGDAAQTFTDASHRFRATMDLYENTLLRALVRRKNPEGVLSMLLSPQRGGSTMRAAETALKDNPDLLQGVRRALWEEVTSASRTEGIYVGDKMYRMLDELTEPTVNLLFGANSAKVKRFAKLLNEVELDPSLARSSPATSILALGQAGVSVGALSQAITTGQTGALTNIAATLLLMGPVGASIMANPLVTEGFLRAAQSPKIGVQTANRLAAAIVSQLAKQTTRPDYTEQIKVTAPPGQP